MEIVFNRNALEIYNSGEGAYLVKVRNVFDKTMLLELLNGHLKRNDGQNDLKIVSYENEEYQNLFLEWQGFIF